MTFLFVATMMLNLDSIRLHGGASDDYYDDDDYYSDDDYDNGCLKSCCKSVPTGVLAKAAAAYDHFIIIILSYIILYHHVSLYHDYEDGCL